MKYTYPDEPGAAREDEGNQNQEDETDTSDGMDDSDRDHGSVCISISTCYAMRCMLMLIRLNRVRQRLGVFGEFF